MRIGLVLSKTPGYSETFFRSKISGLQKQGLKVILLVQKSHSEFDLCEAQVAPKVYRNPLLQGTAFLKVFFKLLLHFKRVRKLWKMERECGKSISQILKVIYLNAHILTCSLDWLHFGFAAMALERENLAHAIGAKMAVSFRGYDINVYPLKHPNCYRLLWERVDKVHSISKYLVEKAFEIGLNKQTPYHIITPAVALASLPSGNFKGECKNPIRIVTVARLHWIKGLDVALKAMALLKKEDVAFTYQIIGEGTQKDFERYAFMAHQLGLRESVQFLGKLNHSETLSKVQKADIYVQPSLNEGFCNAVLEAQALGKICVASDAGGLPENILHEETGFLFETQNVNALVETFLKILKLTDVERDTLSRKAQQRVATHFHTDKQQQEFIAFYTETR